MDDLLGFIKEQQNRSSLFLFSILILSLVVGIILVNQQAIFRSHASGNFPAIALNDDQSVDTNHVIRTIANPPSGSPSKVIVQQVNTANTTTVPILLYSTLTAAPSASASASVTPASTPCPSNDPSVGFSPDTNNSLRNGLINYYPFEDTGSTITDVISAENGTATGTTVVDGKVGKARHFNGTTDSINAPTAGLSNSQYSQTVAAWFKADSLPGSGEIVPIVGGYDTNGIANGGLYIYNDGGTMKIYQPVARSSDGSLIQTLTPYTFQANTWYFMAETYDDSTGDHNVYVNGAPISGGVSPSSALPSNTSGFTGTIDEQGLWSRALTQQEVTDLYNGGNGNTYTLSCKPVSTTGYKLLLTSAPPDPAPTDSSFSGLTLHPYNSTGGQVADSIDFTGAKNTPGNYFIYVQFIGSDNTTDIENLPVTMVEPNPSSTGTAASCTIDPTNTGVLVNITGSYFGASSTPGTLTTSDNKSVQVTGWGDGEVDGLLNGVPSDLTKPLSFNLTRADGQTVSNVSCTINTSTITLHTDPGCPTFTKLKSLDNVEVMVAEDAKGAKVDKETVNIDSTGTISNLKNIFQKNHHYIVTVKAPGSTRVTYAFTAAGTTNNLDFPVSLPLGDVAPVGNLDGHVNDLDGSELTEEMRGAKPIGPADINKDGEDNSFDWACMRNFYNIQDDPTPDAQIGKFTYNSAGNGVPITNSNQGNGNGNSSNNGNGNNGNGNSSASPTPAATPSFSASDDFSSALDIPNKWLATSKTPLAATASLTVSGGALVGTINNPTTATYLTEAYNKSLTGDFTSTVDINITSGGGSTGNSGVSLEFQDGTSGTKQFIVGLRKSGTNTQVYAGVSSSGQWNELGTANVSAPVTVKIQRTDSSYSFYYTNPGGNFVRIGGSAYSDTSAVSGSVELNVFSNANNNTTPASYDSVTGTFDNFMLTTP